MKALHVIPVRITDVKQFIKHYNLDERQRRGLYGFLASQAGYGGATAVARDLEVSPITVKAGADELKALCESDQTTGEQNPSSAKKRVRRSGGGRKKLTSKYPGLMQALAEVLERSTYGDPQRVICWTTLSLRKIQDELNSQGFPVSYVVISELLEEMGYSKQVNQKMLQVSKPHPDRDAQFQFINEKCKAWLNKGLPVISIDCKKKENLGNFKNGGAEYRPKGKPRHVYDHDWLIKELGKVAPFGIYNLNNNVGYVNLGQSRDTAEFASESVARWWHFIGEESFPGCKKLFIVCDGGGSNGSRVRLWKWALACFAEFYGLEIHVSHLPPGTSKWNKVEHRLFSYISKNWAGQPLVDIETVVNLISNTTTRTGLKVRCDIDNNVYLKGTKITDEEFDQIALDPIPEFGTWNYIIRGFKHDEDR